MSVDSRRARPLCSHKTWQEKLSLVLLDLSLLPGSG